MLIGNQSLNVGYEKIQQLAHPDFEKKDNSTKSENEVESTGRYEENDEAVKLDLSSLKKKPEYAKSKLEKDEQKKLEKLAFIGNRQLDPDQYDMVKRLEIIEREVVMHEKAHQATGGKAVGAASYDYTMGPDHRYYVTGGSVQYNLPKAGTPESIIRAFKGLKRSAGASVDASDQDNRMASMAEAKIQDIKTKITSEKGKIIYYTEMIKKKSPKTS